MRKLLLLFILIFLPTTAGAGLLSFELQLPTPYYIPQATLHGECGVNSLPIVEVGSVPATETAIPFTMDANPGDIMSCRFFTTYGTKTSAPSGVSTYTVPFPDLNSPSTPVILFIGSRTAP